MTKKNHPFGYLRSILWPVHLHEVKKIVPLLIVLFLLSFNQSVLWNIKDTLVITSSGAEVIPFIKVWAILPCTFLVTLIFTRLSNRHSQENIFYLMTASFLLFYGFFTFGLYPYRDHLHPFESANYLESILPAGFKGLISMYRAWTFTLFFVLCELWTTMVITVLFWGFVNAFTHISEARRFYSVLSVVYSIAITAAGAASSAIAQGSIPLRTISEHYAWEHTMRVLILIVLANGALAMLLFRWIHQSQVMELGCMDKAAALSRQTKQMKLSLRESLLYVFKSKQLICIAVIVVAYNMVINLTEVAWKDQLRALYPATIDYNHYINNLQVIQGLLAIIISLGMAQLLKWLGWAKTALITPLIMLVSCVFFFGAMLFKDHFASVFRLSNGAGPLALVVFFGSVQNCMSKACKYSLFDSTKEMAFVPLCLESKLKGKAAIDGIGARFGKSGGSLVHQSLLIIFASLSASAPYLAAIMLAVIMLWIFSIRNLNCTILKPSMS